MRALGSAHITSAPSRLCTSHVVRSSLKGHGVGHLLAVTEEHVNLRPHSAHVCRVVELRIGGVKLHKQSTKCGMEYKLHQLRSGRTDSHQNAEIVNRLVDAPSNSSKRGQRFHRPETTHSSSVCTPTLAWHSYDEGPTIAGISVTPKDQMTLKSSGPIPIY